MTAADEFIAHERRYVGELIGLEAALDGLPARSGQAHEIAAFRIALAFVRSVTEMLAVELANDDHRPHWMALSSFVPLLDVYGFLTASHAAVVAALKDDAVTALLITDVVVQRPSVYAHYLARFRPASNPACAAMADLQASISAQVAARHHRRALLALEAQFTTPVRIWSPSVPSRCIMTGDAHMAISSWRPPALRVLHLLYPSVVLISQRKRDSALALERIIDIVRVELDERATSLTIVDAKGESVVIRGADDELLDWHEAMTLAISDRSSVASTPISSRRPSMTPQQTPATSCFAFALLVSDRWFASKLRHLLDKVAMPLLVDEERAIVGSLSSQQRSANSVVADLSRFVAAMKCLRCIVRQVISDLTKFVSGDRPADLSKCLLRTSILTGSVCTTLATVFVRLPSESQSILHCVINLAVDRIDCYHRKLTSMAGDEIIAEAVSRLTQTKERIEETRSDQTRRDALRMMEIDLGGKVDLMGPGCRQIVLQGSLYYGGRLHTFHLFDDLLIASRHKKKPNGTQRGGIAFTVFMDTADVHFDPTSETRFIMETPACCYPVDAFSDTVRHQWVTAIKGQIQKCLDLERVDNARVASDSFSSELEGCIVDPINIVCDLCHHHFSSLRERRRCSRCGSSVCNQCSLVPRATSLKDKMQRLWSRNAPQAMCANCTAFLSSSLRFPKHCLSPSS
ncbi:unnamed protein product (mitochondrion) [Plasmodiophora brassicae]|uniref:FYVE zinc finger domain-containing protein n=1 Tax=Plasmodiophora brassicae TaxID=37360 RepID=A0A3P3YHI9_PLABS|nr:unnamed protein product [Plasmodiophora brassicae]